MGIENRRDVVMEAAKAVRAGTPLMDALTEAAPYDGLLDRTVAYLASLAGVKSLPRWAAAKTRTNADAVALLSEAASRLRTIAGREVG